MRRRKCHGGVAGRGGADAALFAAPGSRGDMRGSCSALRPPDQCNSSSALPSTLMAYITDWQTALFRQ